MGHHDALLTELQKQFTVKLIARHKSGFAPIGLDEYMNVFVPDMHLITPDRQKKYNYGFNSAEMFGTLCQALVKVRNDLGSNKFRVTQMGDFIDLWREGGSPRDAANGILRAFPAIEKNFLDMSPESVGPSLLLGNHDLESRVHPSFERARFSHFLRGWGTAAIATHGDAFDWLEQLFDDTIQSIALRTFIGRGADPQEYLLNGLLTFRKDDVNEAGTNLEAGFPERVQGDSALQCKEIDAATIPDSYNVIPIVNDDDGERKEKHRLLPNMIKTVKRYRVKNKDGTGPDAPDLKAVVIGHSHHARLIVDKFNDLILMDCGAWIESFTAPGVPKTPNRQLGALCGPDFRIYQLDPKV